MSTLHGKRIILGVSGSIAAYKAVALTRLLIKEGAEVQVLMTPAATHFVTPLTFATLSKRPVLLEVISEEGWNNHVELGLWADAMLIAPATANTLAKLAHGHCDNLLTATYLSARCPVFVAPAMDLDMWRHPATRRNLELLLSYGLHLIPVEHGELASGLVGEGRLAEPEHMVARLGAFFGARQTLAGRHLLITAGPTYEPLDPVRFIGNHSTGKMGVAIALDAAARGARVTLVLGPSALQPAAPGLQVVRVQTAREMYDAALAHFPDADAAILSAAVADYRPAQVADKKIKKNDTEFSIQLTRNPDIAAELGRRKQPGQALIGFALETHDAETHARDKLVRKNLDYIVLNSLRDAGAGFGGDSNKVTIFDQNNNRREFELKAKTDVAGDILDVLVGHFATGESSL